MKDGTELGLKYLSYKLVSRLAKEKHLDDDADIEEMSKTLAQKIIKQLSASVNASTDLVD